MVEDEFLREFLHEASNVNKGELKNMTRRKIPFNIPFYAGNELKYLEQVVSQGHFGGNGKFTLLCEELLRKNNHVCDALLVHSCTAALEMSALLLDIQSGDEVILPSYTFCSTATAYLRCGAKLVFAEVDPITLMVTRETVRPLIGERTKAIVPVHYAGNACDVQGLLELVEGTDISVVEDAAQGLGTTHKQRPLGSIGRFGCISFHETKNLHCGLGGALFVNNPEDVTRARHIWERGTNRQERLKGLVDKYTWVDTGSSFYVTELQAAFLYAQFEKYEEHHDKRRAVFEIYEQELFKLRSAGKLQFPERDNESSINCHAFFIVLNTEKESNLVREKLAEQSISAYIGYVPLHSSPMGRKLGYLPGDLPVTEDVASRVVRLPMYATMSKDDARRVCVAIESALGI